MSFLNCIITVEICQYIQDVKIAVHNSFKNIKNSISFLSDIALASLRLRTKSGQRGFESHFSHQMNNILRTGVRSISYSLSRYQYQIKLTFLFVHFHFFHNCFEASNPTSVTRQITFSARRTGSIRFQSLFPDTSTNPRLCSVKI